jgi:hypothetical protein
VQAATKRVVQAATIIFAFCGVSVKKGNAAPAFAWEACCRPARAHPLQRQVDHGDPVELFPMLAWAL